MSSTSRSGGLRRAAVGLAATVGIGAAVIGVLHAPFAKSALMKVGGCPVGKASAADIENARKHAVASMRGDTAAKNRPALGFILEGSTPDDVRGWARENGVTCAEKREGTHFTCQNVPAKALRDRDPGEGSATEVHLTFRPSDRRLVNVSVTSSGLAADDAAKRMNRRVERLTTDVGAPTKTAGEISAERFGMGGFATSVVAYRYSNYIAEVTATSFDGRGVHLMEHYVTAND